ncbi:MAG TPA: glycoside hydrolase family 2 TIM barrel-domain containing protein, partial [Phototrophicaceae bacterium]|nr:glycoside hydrolase family 2 TIM barrel-domain containing protein [Phototrophicaceae bacterium]
FDVSDKLNFDGDNLLAVVIEPAPHEQPQIGRTSKVTTFKSRMTYWWDFCPRIVHLGIWDDVYLEVTDNVRITDVLVRQQLSDDLQHVTLNITAQIDTLEAVNAQFHASIYFGHKNFITSREIKMELTSGQRTVSTQIELDQPQLWWPNGYGDQPLYTVGVSVDTGWHRLAEREYAIGIRKIELVPNEDTDPLALPYTFVVNGRKIYAKGWNWVPLDVMYGVERPDKLEHLFGLAKNANVNLLRVWGGGLIEKEAFYNLADRLGILIWQEFILSSSGIDNFPSESPEYVAMLTHEAEQIIPRKRNHPSLALWCGGNELTADENVPLDDQHAALAALKAVVARLDPDRLWLPTSPSGPVFGNDLANIVRDPTSLHDVHGPWEFQGVSQQQELYNAGASLFHSEFGVEGMTNRKALDATLAPEQQAPVSLDNAYWQHLGAWWVKEKVWRETFGEVADVETLRKATQLMQAEGLRYALEADRRRQFHNSGTLPWQFNEPFPMAACTSAVDYYGQAKPAYYAVARAYAPISVTAKFATLAWGKREAFAAELWAVQDSLSALEASISARLISMSGQVYQEWTRTASIPANRAASIASIQHPLAAVDDVFFLDLEWSSGDQPLAVNRYLFTRGENLMPLLHVLATTVRVERDAQGETLTITNTGDQAALCVWLEDAREIGAPGFAEFSDNHFCLLPGETRLIVVSWQNVSPQDRRIDVHGWNTNHLSV